MSIRKLPSLLAATTVAVILAGGAALFGYANTMYCSGRGLVADGFRWLRPQDRTLWRREWCRRGRSVSPVGAHRDGGVQREHHRPVGAVPMVKSGNGAFKFVGGVHPRTLFPGVVVATYDGKPKNVQLVISHGCRPLLDTAGAWCSPGFWRNAQDGAWALRVRSTASPSRA